MTTSVFWCPAKRSAEAVPVRAQLPLPGRERIHLERLRQLVDVELLTDGGLVTRALHEIVDARDRPRGDVADKALHVAERLERLPERPARHAVLARQRTVRHAVCDRPFGDLFREPEKARADELELDREIQRDALVERLLERGRQREVEFSRQQHVALVDAQFRRRHGDRICACRNERARGRAGDDQRQRAAPGRRARRATGTERMRHAGGTQLSADPGAGTA